MNSPIGILDSGLGGLSVLNEIRKILPSESLIYFGDSAWCPYGAREADEIQRRVFAVTDFLIDRGCNHFQGYYFGRPNSADSLQKFFDQ